MKNHIIAALALLFSLQAAQAQSWQQVQQLYDAGMYAQAVRLTGDSQEPAAKAFRALCALEMRQADALRQAEGFLTAHPESALAAQIRYKTALYLFDAGSYQDALRHLDLLEEQQLYASQRTEYLYRRGYCAYKTQQWDRARKLLERVAAQPYSDYTAPSCFTLGYMSYALEEFGPASAWFEKAQGDPRFADLAGFYLLECRFNQKDYAYVTENGERLFAVAPQERKAHLARLLGESFLVQGQVDKAGEYYRSTPGGESTRSDAFYAGQIHYLQQNWQEAVDAFGRMGERTDSLGQVASYQMGYSYIRLRNKVAALDAFKEAAQVHWSPAVTEDAFYNYAKLAFDLGRDTAPFQEYLKRYGTREKGDQIYTYIAMVALQNRDYEGAVDAYDHVDELQPRQLSNYRKAYFLRARQLMELGAWRGAVLHLKAAAYYGDRSDAFNQLSRYYLAEAYYRDARYADARAVLKQLYNLGALQGTQEGSLIAYQLGYTFFKEADYAQAGKWFRSYLEGKNTTEGADALTRLGDCHFFSRRYKDAVTVYEQQMDRYPDANNLYPRLRAAVASGLVGEESRKAALLEKTLQARPGVPYYGECLYELGRSYVALKREKDAVHTFSTLLSSTQDPSLSARSLLELGMIARNAGRSDDALDCYKQVVAQGGEYAEDALLAIESIYRTREDPQAYLAYVNSLGEKANRTDAQKEEVFFASAEQLYLSGEYAKAQLALEAYMEQYPQPSFKAKAQFYLAECHRAAGNKEQATDAYACALDAGLEGALAESATLQCATLHYALGNYAKAYGWYLQLKEGARLEPNREAAGLGLMRSAFRARQWEDALSDARAVLDSQPEEALAREARYVCAKSLLGSSRREEALPLLETLAGQPATPEGAEAAYLLIQDRLDRGDYAAVQDRVYAFAGEAGGQDYWLAKAFIALGDSFAEQGQVDQARATFESIRSGYTSTGPQDDVPDQVEMRLRKL